MKKVILVAAATAALVLTGPQADAARHHKPRHHHPVVQVQVPAPVEAPTPPSVPTDWGNCTTNALGVPASHCPDDAPVGTLDDDPLDTGNTFCTPDPRQGHFCA